MSSIQVVSEELELSDGLAVSYNWRHFALSVVNRRSYDPIEVRAII